MKLMGAAEIATYLGISRQRVQQLARLEHFPEPVAYLTMGKVWRRKDIIRWKEEYRGAPRF